MTVTEKDLAHAVGWAIIFPTFQARLGGEAKRLVEYIESEVEATERPSTITAKEGNPIDRDIRRRIVAQTLTLASIAAVDFGEREDAKRTSGSRLPKPA